jgi:pSer/pThr/pTyr-binding forkhead associated (FHA) protein
MFPLPKEGVATMGRGREAFIRLNDLQVSRLHCRLDMGGTRIQDAGSIGGTFVNGLRISEHVLRDGDTIRIGETELAFRKPT